MSLFSTPMATSTSGGTSTGSRTATTSYPAWTQQANQGLFQTGMNLLGPDMNRPQDGWVAPFNPDQNTAFQMTRDMAQGQQAGNPQQQAALNALGNGAGRVNPAQLDPTAFRPFMNPFLDSVGKSTLNTMRDEYQNADANLASQYAARQAFGGSGEAIARGQLAKGYTENVGSAISNLMAQGYDRATASAMANTQMQQDANVRNAAFEQNLPAIYDAATNAQLTRQRATLQDLLGVGGMQQTRDQTVRDVPLRNLEILLGLTPNVYDQTQTATENSTTTGTDRSPTGAPSTGQQLLGFGLDTLSRALF